MLWNIFAELDNNKQSIEKSCFAISNMISALKAMKYQGGCFNVSYVVII